MPYKNANGMRYDNVSPLETFEQAVEILGYGAFRAEQATAFEAGRYLGVGFSNYVEPTTPVFGIFSTEAATIRIEPTGKVNVYVAGGSSGNSLETAVVQLTADALGVDIEDVNTIQGDTALTGFGGGTGGSRSGDARRRDRRDRRRAAAADRGHRRPPLRGRRGRHRALAELGARARDAGDDDVPRRDRQPRLLLPRRAARRCPPGLEASSRFSPKARRATGPTPPTSAPARSTSPPGR